MKHKRTIINLEILIFFISIIFILLPKSHAFEYVRDNSINSTLSSYHSFQSYNYQTHYIRHQNFRGKLSRITSTLEREDSVFKMVTGLADSNCISFESYNSPGYFFRHSNFHIYLEMPDGTQLFKEDATFCKQLGLANPNWTSFESYNYSGYFLRHYNFDLELSTGNSDVFKQDATFKITMPLTQLPVVERGILGDGWADIVIGQPDFTQITPNEVVGNKLFNPGGIAVDRTVQPNRVYVYDAGNNRVLGLTHLGICEAGANVEQHCTSDSDCSGSICQIQNNRHADIVLGQPTFNSSACNGDSGVQGYPDIPSGSADSLCGTLQTAISTLESGSMATMAIDSNGNLYITDLLNHRVLRYDTPFDSDTVADYVWGQSDFTNSSCNNKNQPDNKSLCLAPLPGSGAIKSGVAIDLEGNLWVADTRNNRVLRFPFDTASGIQKQEANLVLGQPDFSNTTSGNALSQMNSPASVRVDHNGTVYVADGVNGSRSEGRVLVFESPFSNGMSASGTIGSGLGEPTGLEIDPNGGLWVNDSDNQRLLHFLNGVLQDTVSLAPGWGGLGIDRDGNVMLTGWESQQVLVYSSPTYIQGATFLQADEYGFFNQTGPRGLHEGLGLEIAAGQLIYGDSSRLLFWNNPWDLVTFQAADGVIGEPDFQSWHRWGVGFHRMRADDQGRLWIIRGNWIESKIEAYELPLQTGAEPIITITSPISLQGGGEFSWMPTLNLGGIAVQPGCDCLWLSDSDSNRVFRIMNASSEQRVVDIVLGQTDATGIHCNHGRDSDNSYTPPSYPTQDSLCHPGGLAFDTHGNLFVSDHSLEVAGNRRLLEFDAEIIPEAPISAVFGIPATRVFGRNGDFTEPNCLPEDPICMSWEPAFDSQGRMIVGFNGYSGLRFPQIFQDPLVNSLPTAALNDFYSQPISTRFDQFDNLYMLDLTRHRILIYRDQHVQTYSLTGTIETMEGTPISGVQVETSGFASNSISNELGVFELTGLITDTYTLSPSKNNCTFIPLNLAVDVPVVSGDIDFVANCTPSLYLPMIQKD